MNQAKHVFFVSTLSLLAVMGLFGCQKGKTGIDLPRYPGADYMAMPVREFEAYDVHSALLRTPMEAQGIGQWYSEKLGPEWEKHVGGQFGSEFSNNMKMIPGQDVPQPTDPTRVGSYIQVEIGGTIMLYQSMPKKKAP
jgi:hypothetical protein